MDFNSCALSLTPRAGTLVGPLPLGEGNSGVASRNFDKTAGWKPGVRILDVGCGSGFPALAAAASIRPGGSVVATDISPEMLAVASSRANADGLDNIEFVEMDAEQLKFDDAEFDVVTNAYGLMFCPDVPRAFREAHRVLRPGGRFVFNAWDRLDRRKRRRWLKS